MIASGQILDICDSTQKLAREYWDKGVWTPGDWVCSLEQTAGRGRRGNQWVSNRGNFFFSILLPEPHAERVTWSAMMGALAVARALPEFSIQLKWPNDVYLNHGKLGGVIAEKLDGAILLGIGVNLIESPALKDRVTSHLGGRVGVEELCKRVRKELAFVWSKFISTQPDAFLELKAEYSACSFFRSGDTIRWLSGVSEFEGTFDSVGKWGELIVKTPSGAPLSLYSEDVFAIRSSRQ